MAVEAETDINSQTINKKSRNLMVSSRNATQVKVKTVLFVHN